MAIFVNLAEGHFGGFFGWPNLTLTPTGGFMGMPASGKTWRYEGNRYVSS